MISILDTTYREGRQSYIGHTLPDSLVDFAKILEKIGIEYMEVAYPFVSDKYLHQFRALINSRPNIQLCVHSALNADNFEKLIHEGVRLINTSLKLRELNKAIIDEQVVSLQKIVNLCHEKFNTKLSLRVSIEHAFKLPINFVVELCKKIAAIDDVARVSLSDTDGTASPEVVRAFLSELSNVVPKHKALELHLHNDQGLSAASFYAAYMLFKDSDRELIIDSSVGGIGERNGITSTGDVLSVVTSGGTSKYTTRYYEELYGYVFGNTKFDRDPLNPNSFTHTSGLHISKFIESGTYQSIDPAKFGFKTKLVFNESLSSDAVRTFAKVRLGMDLSKEEAVKLASKIRNLSAVKKTEFNESEIARLIKTGGIL